MKEDYTTVHVQTEYMSTVACMFCVNCFGKGTNRWAYFIKDGKSLCEECLK